MNDDASPPFRDGWWAHKEGVDIDKNPYKRRRQSWSHGQWQSGWCRRFEAVKHDQRDVLRSGDQSS